MRRERLAAGQVIGRYRVDAILGSGGMGIVARAHDLDLDRDVALKVALVTGDDARDRSRAELLLREARAMAGLHAPHVRAVHDVGTAAGIDYVAMEYIAGADLADWLAGAPPRSWREVVRVFCAAGRGLAAAHAAGILHRDFKAANVLVADDGRVVVTDFGIAGELDAGGDALADQRAFRSAASAALPADAPPRLRAILASDHRDVASLVRALDAAARRRTWPLVAGGVAFAAAAASFALAERGGDVPAGENPVLAALVREATTNADRGYLATARRYAEAARAQALPGHAAAANYMVGAIALVREDIAAARTALEAAVRLGDAERDDTTRARALLALFQIAVTRGSDRAATDRTEQAATAALSRIAPDREARSLLAYLRAVRADNLGDAAAATRGYREARALVTPPGPHELVTWAEIGRTQVRRALAAGDRDAAIAIDRELVAVAEKVGGADHIATLSARGELATSLEATGNYAGAAAVMAELHAFARTPAGERLLDEIAGDPRPPRRTVRVVVRDARGAPVAGAEVIAATDFRSNGTNLVAAASLFDEAARSLVTATTGASGEAELAVAQGRELWLAAEHLAIGRSPSSTLHGDRAELVLAPWGRLAGRVVASTHPATIVVAPAAQPDAPRIEVTADREGQFVVERIPHGDYVLAACIRGDGFAACRTARATVAATTAPPPLAITEPAGPATLTVAPRDELARPIESSTVFVLPAGYAPADIAALESRWLADAPPGTAIAWTSVHGAAPARLAGLATGAHELCALAVHGDTEDSSLASRLRHAPVPLHCTPIVLAPGARHVDLTIPAARRVWLGD